MRIVIDTRFLTNEMLQGYNRFLQELLFRIVDENSEHQFFFLLNEPTSWSKNLPANVTIVSVSSNRMHKLQSLFWYNFKLPLLLKKLKADVYVSTNGFVSLTTGVPQLLMISELASSYRKLNHSPGNFFKSLLPKFIKKSKVVVTFSEHVREELQTRYKTPPDKIVNIGCAINQTFKPVEWEQREAIKEKYVDGFEYFLFVDELEPNSNLLNLLKAFTQFKVRQRSSMKLLVTGKYGEHDGDTLEKLNTYKLKDDVRLTGALPEEEYAQVLASAYALIAPAHYKGFAVNLVAGLHAGVPVITGNNSAMAEVAGNAALYVDPADPNSIGEQLKLIYKDERLRKQLINRGKIQAEKYNWSQTTNLFRKAIEQAVSK